MRRTNYLIIANCLAAIASGSTAPSIAAGGVVSAASYAAGVAPGSWISIFGQNLATSTAVAGSSDLVNGYLPTTLGGASVTIDGIPAYVDYASPSLINVESPADSGSGTVTVTVTTSAGTATATVTLAPVQPGIFTFGNYVAAVRPSDSTIINGTGTAVSGYSTAEGAHPGDVISLYLTGLGATTTSVPAGLVFTGAYPTSVTPTVTIGGVSADVSFSGLVTPGEYQINLTVPSSLTTGVYPVVVTQSTISSQTNSYLIVLAPTVTTTTLVSSATSATSGTAVKLTAAVNSSAATGTVSFYDGTTLLGTGTLNAGVATYTSSSLKAGLHPMNAVYAGDGTYSSSTSSPIAVNITATSSAAATTTTLTSSAASLVMGSSVTLTASVTPSATSGTVTFYDGAVSIGTSTLSSGTATLATATLAPGIHAVYAAYVGGSTYAASTSAAVTIGVTAAGASPDCSALSGVAQVVCLTTYLESTLTASQLSTLQLSYTLANVEHWSNLPLGIIGRNGLQFSTLSSVQLGAALAVANAALSADGFERLREIRAADDNLNSVNSGMGWGSGNYFMAFDGTPSTTSPWMLQVNGHHFALNHTFNGTYTSATPYFIGVEPPVFNTPVASYAPLEKQRSAMYALNQTLLGNSAAALSGTFDDVVEGVSGSTSIDTNYPHTYPSGTTGRGVLASALTAGQQTLIKAAIEAWVNDADSITASQLVSTYEDSTALANTYVGYSGDGTLIKVGDYIRIDGPRVWIELVVQSGIAYQNSYHYHTIWRDKTADYGGDFQ